MREKGEAIPLQKCRCSHCRIRIMMKKYASKVLAATMAVSMMVPGMNVLAAETPTTTTGTTASTNASADVKYEVTQGYAWTIHADINFDKDAGAGSKTVVKSGNTVSVGKNIIPDGKTLNIAVKGSGTDGAYEIKNGNTALTYTIKNGSTEIKPNGNVISLAAGNNTISKDLTFTLTTTSESAEVAGNYTGTVTYTATID